MSQCGCLDEALERVTRERRHVDSKLDAVNRFRTRVRNFTTNTAGHSAEVTQTTAGLTARTMALDTGESPTSKWKAQVRRAFEETIRPHSVADLSEPESLSETVRAELGSEVELALATGSNTPFLPAVKQAVLSASKERTAELRAMRRGLQVEAQSVSDARDELSAVAEWLELKDCSLMSLGFDTLCERHETLAGYRTHCTRLGSERQHRLHESSGYEHAARISHQSLASYLYDDLPVAHPVLDAVVRTDRRCADRQRAIRDHLSRRV
ncbi:hypothetical protein ACFQJC_07220 [Haloferax namakaokahaiae]|uniref:DUF7260 domain-containing protein n=1 Tax=Haloferax namakaokahaiae TaxID=1748331 RepID=A0ABD5ZDM3_9EURY